METKVVPIDARSIEILLVEDNPADIELTREGLKECKLAANLHVVNNGEDAMFFLRRQGDYADRPRPDLVLMDINMPRMSGLEALRAIRADPDLTGLPVVILTTSGAEEDIAGAYNLNVNCYVTKPLGFEQFQKVVRTVGNFWFTIVRLPD